MQNMVVLSLILSTICTQLHEYGGEQFFLMLRSTDCFGKLEQMLVIQILTRLRLKLIGSPAHLQQKKRPEIIAAYNPDFCLRQNSTVCDGASD